MCVIAFAPGTTGPSIEVVRKIFFPQTIGEECPRPGISVFQIIFFEPLHSSGRFFSLETPAPPGPRHWGQLVSSPADETEVPMKAVEERLQIRAATRVRIARLVARIKS